MRAENTKAANNPLATTQPANGASDFNSSGVKNYPSFQTGVTATIQTLQNGYYNGIVNDLRKGNISPYNIITNNAAEFDKWGTGAGLLSSLSGGPAPGPVSIWQFGQNWTTGATDIKNAALKPLGGIEKDILYAVAFLGGILLILTGFILIGADLGIAILGRSRVTKTATRIYRPNRRSDAFEQAGREHAQFLRAESKRQGRHPVKQQAKHEEPKRKSTPGPNQRRLTKKKETEEIPF